MIYLFIQELKDKVQGIIENNQNDFFLAFKNKMVTIMNDMNILKEKASAERIKAKQDQRLINLETERDWFRKEALSLSRASKSLKDQLQKLKKKYDYVYEEKIYFQTQLYDERMNSKVIAQENLDFK